MTWKLLLSTNAVEPTVPAGESWETIRREFPTVSTEQVLAVTSTDCIIDAQPWQSITYDPFEFDRRVGDAATGPLKELLLVGEELFDPAVVALQVLTRYQGRLNRRNHLSRGEQFDRVLAAHRELHDLAKPLVRADYNHSLDVWQWMLRLAPEASLAAQLAALFHDIERLKSEADTRIEQHATDYQAFKDAHARSGAEMTAEILTREGISAAAIRKVQALITHHERRADDPELALLNDADALSFFSLNSPGFLDYYGPEHTRKKIAYSLARMRSPARERLQKIRFRADVELLVKDQLKGEPP